MRFWQLDDDISIHAPREGSDRVHFAAQQAGVISIHAPREGSDALAEEIAAWNEKFLSTLPARGATMTPPSSPHSRGISIHAPREGSDLDDFASSCVLLEFLSTLPARGATDNCPRNMMELKFLSTLPARGATLLMLRGSALILYFYPRSPRGERR